MKEKYFRLFDIFAARGWRDLEYTLQHQLSGTTFYLPKGAADALFLALNGISYNSPAMLPFYRRILEQLVQEGFGEWQEEFRAPAEFQLYRKADCNCTMSIHWSITGRCNLQCRHCYLDAPDGFYGEMSLEQCVAIMDQMVAANISNVSITGGEPLVRKDWWQFVEALKERKLHINTIYTNGLLVTEEWLEKFKAQYSEKILFSLSFDGIGCHDWVRGKEGMERRTIDAIKLLIDNGYPIEIETAIYKDNLPKLPATCELFAELGIRNWKLSPIMEGKAWARYSAEHTANMEDIISGAMMLLEKFEELDRPFNLQISHFYYYDTRAGKAKALVFGHSEGDSSFKLPVCGCMRQHPYLLPNGTLMPCMPLSNCGLDVQMPNLLKTPLSKVLQPGSALYELTGMSWGGLLEKHPGPCSECPHKAICRGGCRAYARQCGDLYGPDLAMCRYFNEKLFEHFERFMH